MKLNLLVITITLVLIQGCSNRYNSLNYGNKNIIPVRDLKPWDLWHRIRQGFSFSLDIDHENTNIENEIAFYSSNNFFWDETIKRARPYLYFIVEEVAQRGMPMEIALLPSIESSFDPYAFSHAGASGLWQLMPGTASSYGLQDTWWYDSRRDIFKSTKVALDYIQYLYTHLQDWELSLAAFNAGLTTVRKAINYNKEKNLSTNFWRLKLPQETRLYITKLVALSKVVGSPEKYKIIPSNIPNEPHFDIVTMYTQIDLDKISELTNIPLEVLYKLNPAVNQKATPPNEPYHLLVPKDKSTLVKISLARLGDKDRVVWKHYKVKVGDTLTHICQIYNLELSILKEVNKLEDNTIFVDQILLIPQTRENNIHLNSDGTYTQNYTIHSVKAGESLSTIANKYHITLPNLLNWNRHVSEHKILKIDEHLIIKNNDQQKITKIKYIIKAGDSFSKVASKFKVNPKDLYMWNAKMMETRKNLHPGDEICVYISTK